MNVQASGTIQLGEIVGPVATEISEALAPASPNLDDIVTRLQQILSVGLRAQYRNAQVVVTRQEPNPTLVAEGKDPASPFVALSWNLAALAPEDRDGASRAFGKLLQLANDELHVPESVAFKLVPAE